MPQMPSFLQQPIAQAAPVDPVVQEILAGAQRRQAVPHPQADADEGFWKNLLAGLKEEVTGAGARKEQNLQARNRERLTGVSEQNANANTRRVDLDETELNQIKLPNQHQSQVQFGQRQQVLGSLTPIQLAQAELPHMKFGDLADDRQRLDRAISEGAAAGAGATAEWTGGQGQVEADQYGPGSARVLGRLQEIKASGDQSVRSAGIRAEGSAKLSPNQELLAINRLQKDWTTATQNHRELTRQAANMKLGLDAAKAGDMAAGSQAVLVTFQKILDPTSVVRESEYARSAAGQSAMNQIQGFYERLATGGAGVKVDELEKFALLADQFVRQAGSGLTGRRARLEATAKEYGLNPSLIFDSDVGSDPAAATSSAVPPAVSAALQGAADGTHTLSDGSVWQKSGASITKVK